MTRYGFLLYHADVEPFLVRLRELGVVDVTLNHFTPTALQSDMIGRAELCGKIGRELRSISAQGDSFASVDSAIEAYQSAKERIAQIESAIQRSEVMLRQVGIWGDFDPKSVDKLREQGVVLRFFEASTKAYRSEWEHRYPIEVISHSADQVHFVVACDDKLAAESLDISAVELAAPSSSAPQIEQDIERLISEQAALQLVVARVAHCRVDIEQLGQTIGEKIDFMEVLASGQRHADGTLVIMEGWSPVDNNAAIEEFVKGEDVIYTIEDAKAEQNPPIKLKNSFFARAFEPIGDLYMLPRYDELDMTPFFAPFFMIFFGMCMGDAGYGLLLISAVLIFWRKIPPKFKGFGWLIIFLNSAAIVFGLFTGNLFGIELVKIDALVRIKQFVLSPNDVFYLSLILGGAQLIFGLILRTFNRIKRGGSFVYGLSNIGWLILIISSLLALSGIEFFTAYFAIHSIAYIVSVSIAGFLILFFAKPGKPLVSFGKGLYNCYEMATGLVGDLISYVRLFAIGLAGTIIAQVFNELAVGLSGNIPVISFLLMLVILFIGHGLNMFISVLGAVVHPIRLTFVEFYKNAEFEGGGRRFRPFARREKIK